MTIAHAVAPLVTFHRARVVRAAHERWSRKAPQNRVFMRTIRNDKGQSVMRKPLLNWDGVPMVRPEPRRALPPYSVERRFGNFVHHETAEHLVVADYLNARRPSETAAGVRPLAMSAAQVEGQLVRYEAWYNEPR